MSWFAFAILSATFWGIEGFLEKIAGKNGYDSRKISSGMAISASILSLMAIFIFKNSATNFAFLVFIAFCNAFSFLIYFISRIESLRTVAASIFFPVSKVGALILQVTIALIFLHERIGNMQWVALIASIIAIYFLTWTKNNAKESRPFIYKGLLFLAISTIFAATTNFAADIASHKTDVYSFSFVSYLFVIPFSLLISRLSFTGKAEKKMHSFFDTYRLAFGIGALNFLGLVTFFLALKLGLFSIVGAINNFSILITILLAIIIYKERPSVKQIFGIIISFIALFLFNP